MIKNNYHTHVFYCNHADGTVDDYVARAVELGFEEIGITDHAPILEHFMSRIEYEDNWCEQNMKLDTVPLYLNDIELARKKYGSRIRILSGFESEFLPEQFEFYKDLRKKVDYLNLGIHYFKYKNKILNSYVDITYETLEGYVETAIEGMKSGLFNTLVHPDLFMFNYKNVNGKRKFDSFCVEATKRICLAAIEYNVYLEVNANGLKNSKTYGSSNDWLYPYYEFWEIARNYPQLKIIIGADAHTPSSLNNENVEAVYRFSMDLGLEIKEKMEIKH